MSFTTASYRTARDSNWQKLAFTKALITTVAGRTYSTWKCAGGDPGAAANPGATAVAHTSANAGAFWENGTTMRNSSGVARIVRIACQFANTPGAGLFQVCDRISSISGFSGITTGSITCNTVAPSRYASGAESRGIMAAVEIYTVIGTTADVVSMNSYTNSDGTTTRVGLSTTIGGTGFREIQRLIQLPLQSGDLGVRSVETISRTATTGTAGDFGVTVYKPLLTIPIHGLGPATTEEEMEGMGFVLPQIVSGACLFGVLIAASTSTGIIHGEISLGEE